MDQYNLHGHHQVMHQDYLTVPQMSSVATQNYPAQSPNSYGSIPMTTVIQHRMTSNHGNLTTHNPLPSPHQRLGASPSACSVSGNNFYVGSGNIPHPVSHTPTPTPTPSATPTLQQQMNASSGSGTTATGGPSGLGNVSSLSKLQQLTNGLEMNQPCNTPPGASSVNLTPNHHPHNTMTPPPTSHLINQNRNLATPPSSAQMASLQQYHKYYSGNLNVTPPIAINQNSGRPSRSNTGNKKYTAAMKIRNI